MSGLVTAAAILLWVVVTARVWLSFEVQVRLAIHVLDGLPLAYRLHTGPLVFGRMDRMVMHSCLIDGALVQDPGTPPTFRGDS